jgi:chemotaxis protein CheX
MTPASTRTTISVQPEELAKMIFNATQEVFTSMMGCEIQQLPDTETTLTDSFDGVLSLIGLAGPVIGNGVLACSAEAARDLSSQLLYTQFTSVDEQVLDAVGEITNMIVGGFKNLLEVHIGQLQMSIPTVIFGKNIATRNSRADVVVTVRCAFPKGQFELTVRLAAAREPGLNVRSF